jgi:hypothetical protein
MSGEDIRLMTLSFGKPGRAVVAQMGFEWTAMTQDTTTAPKIARRAHRNPRNGITEYEDIGPFTGKRPIVEIRPGSRKCQCGRCGLAFTSVDAFDKHQRLIDGAVICLSPETVGLVFKNGWWSGPSDPRFAKGESE